MSVFNKERLSFLDGLRGWGAVIVVLYHVWLDGFPISVTSVDVLEHVFVFNGYLAVYVFFLVSGFSLSIGYIRSGDALVLKKIAIGRYIRLALPVGFVASIFYVAQCFSLVPDPSLRPPKFQSLLTTVPNFIDFFWFHLFQVFFLWDSKKAIIFPLWTMSYEFIGSLLLTFSLWVTGGRFYQLATLVALGFVVSFINLFFGLFFCGAVFAHLYAHAKPELIKKFAWPVFFLTIGLSTQAYKLGVYAQLICAVGLFYSSIHCIPINRFFSSRVSLALGRISFPLYLIHGPVMWTIGLSLYGEVDTVFVNLAVILVSFVAAYLLVPVDTYSTYLSRAFAVVICGRRVGSAWRR